MLKSTVQSPSTQIGAFLQVISPPARLEILLAIGKTEACVCHLEAALGLRQAYISQHLMALRDAGVITSRRDGRFVFYALANPELLAFIKEAGRMSGLDIDHFLPVEGDQIVAGCDCPRCNSQSTACRSEPVE